MSRFGQARSAEKKVLLATGAGAVDARWVDGRRGDRIACLRADRIREQEEAVGPQ